MGPKYADPVILDLKAMWEESDSRTPMICLLSMGSDPTAMIEDLAKKNGIGLYFCVDWVTDYLNCMQNSTMRHCIRKLYVVVT